MDGYTQFAIRVPRSLLNSAAPNVLAVRVNNSGSNSRWYSGSGLHRPVTLLTYSKMHIVPPHAGGVYVLTPNVKLHSNGTVADADANVSIAVQNEDGTAPSKPTRSRTREPSPQSRRWSWFSVIAYERRHRRQRFWQVNGVDKLVFRVGGGSSVCGEEPRRLALAALRAFFSLGLIQSPY